MSAAKQTLLLMSLYAVSTGLFAYCLFRGWVL